jgi:hypothetical protein
MTARCDSRIIPTQELPAGLRATLFDACSDWYVNYGEEYFFQELDLSEHTFVLTDRANGDFAGFGSLRRLELDVAGQAVGAFYTGHAFSHPGYWGTHEPVRSMVAHMLRHAAAHREREWFWLYSATGYRAYRYMPALFQAYVPQENGAPDPLADCVRALVGRRNFEQYYDEATGLIDWQWEGYGLSRQAAEITAAKADNAALRDYARFNPKWAEGVELLCIARLTSDNLTRLARHWAANATA